MFPLFVLLACSTPAPTEAPTPPPAAATDADGARYTCPMDRDVQSDAPGKCPKCGMDLVKEGEVSSHH